MGLGLKGGFIEPGSPEPVFKHRLYGTPFHITCLGGEISRRCRFLGRCAGPCASGPVGSGRPGGSTSRLADLHMFLPGGNSRLVDLLMCAPGVNKQARGPAYVWPGGQQTGLRTCLFLARGQTPGSRTCLFLARWSNTGSRTCLCLITIKHPGFQQWLYG